MIICMGSILLSRFSLGGPAGRAGRFLAPVVVTLGCILALPAGAFADSFSVSEWFLGIAAHNASVSEYQDASFETVQSPFVGEHSVSLTSSPSTTASAQYLIEYISNYGSSSSVNTVASGGVRVAVTEPLPLHIESSWTYNMPADFMMSGFGVSIRSLTDQTLLFHEEYHPQTWPGDPWSGTLTIQGDVTLTPGHTWRLSYNMDLEADAGPGFSATGSGFVNFTISPEGSTLALLAPLLLAVSRRATRPRRSS
jgi:hypothetical protein